MKNKIILLSALVLSVLTTQAQETIPLAGKTSFGLRAGVNFQNINGEANNGNKLENDLLTAYHLGITLDLPIALDFFFQTGLLYSVKGAKIKDAFPGQIFDNTLRISYLELPLNLLYKPMLGKGRLLLGFGPYVALGVSGNADYNENNSGGDIDVKFQNTVKTTDPLDRVYIRPVDAGANLLIGYEFNNKVSFQLNSQLGLLKINPEYDLLPNDDSKARNTGFGVSLGYRF